MNDYLLVSNIIHINLSDYINANQVTNKHLCKVTIIYDNKALLKNNTNADQI